MRRAFALPAVFTLTAALASCGSLPTTQATLGRGAGAQQPV